MRVGIFNTRMLFSGDKYGLDNALTYDGPPMIEFYDSRFDFTPLGQFVTRRDAQRMFMAPSGAVSLDCGVPAWSLTSGEMDQVKRHLLGELL